jgi:hypothetical protein
MSAMPSTWIGLCAPLTAFVLHILAYRLIPAVKNFPRQKLAVLVIGGAVAFSVALAYYLDLGTEQILNAGILSIMFGYSYFHFFNMSETARRIRILVEYVAGIRASSSGYDKDKIFGNRITRMGETGLIKETDGKLQAQNGPILWAAYVILTWRKMFFPN